MSDQPINNVNFYIGDVKNAQVAEANFELGGVVEYIDGVPYYSPPGQEPPLEPTPENYDQNDPIANAIYTDPRFNIFTPEEKQKLIERKLIGINTEDKLYELADFKEACLAETNGAGEVGYQGFGYTTGGAPYIVINNLLCLNPQANFSQQGSFVTSENPIKPEIIQAGFIAQGVPNPSGYQDFSLLNTRSMPLSNYSLEPGGLFRLLQDKQMVYEQELIPLKQVTGVIENILFTQGPCAFQSIEILNNKDRSCNNYKLVVTQGDKELEILFAVSNGVTNTGVDPRFTEISFEGLPEGKNINNLLKVSSQNGRLTGNNITINLINAATERVEFVNINGTEENPIFTSIIVKSRKINQPNSSEEEANDKFPIELIAIVLAFGACIVGGTYAMHRRGKKHEKLQDDNVGFVTQSAENFANNEITTLNTIDNLIRFIEKVQNLDQIDDIEKIVKNLGGIENRTGKFIGEIFDSGINAFNIEGTILNDKIRKFLQWQKSNTSPQSFNHLLKQLSEKGIKLQEYNPVEITIEQEVEVREEELTVFINNGQTEYTQEMRVNDLRQALKEVVPLIAQRDGKWEEFEVLVKTSLEDLGDGVAVNNLIEERNMLKRAEIISKNSGTLTIRYTNGPESVHLSVNSALGTLEINKYINAINPNEEFIKKTKSALEKKSIQEISVDGKVLVIDLNEDGKNLGMGIARLLMNQELQEGFGELRQELIQTYESLSPYTQARRSGILALANILEQDITNNEEESIIQFSKDIKQEQRIQYVMEIATELFDYILKNSRAHAKEFDEAFTDPIRKILEYRLGKDEYLAQNTANREHVTRRGLRMGMCQIYEEFLDANGNIISQPKRIVVAVTKNSHNTGK